MYSVERKHLETHMQSVGATSINQSRMGIITCFGWRPHSRTTPVQSLSTEVASPFLQDPEPLQCGHQSSLESRSINEQNMQTRGLRISGQRWSSQSIKHPSQLSLSAADISAKLSSFHGFENFQCCGGKGLLPQSAKNLGCHMSWFQIRPFKG